MEYTTEVINITRIKEGLYIGDQIAATNLDVIIQFKLTHMINATGTQIFNQWERIGIKYLTLNWSETPTQNLFDSKDEIANRIVSFIDDSLSKGEGLLAHSVRGQNRVCIVILIYLIKKYKWCLSKSFEFLKSKKQDIDIPQFFYNQLVLFENRMIKKGEEITNIPWSEENLNDAEEKLLRNTYINSIKTNPSMVSKEMYIIKGKRHIGWADSNPYKKEMLVYMNVSKDLFYQKDVKAVTSHKRLRPSRSCMKMKRGSEELKLKRNNSKSNLEENSKGGNGLQSDIIDIKKQKSNSNGGFKVNNIKTIKIENNEVEKNNSFTMGNTGIKNINLNANANNNINIAKRVDSNYNMNIMNNFVIPNKGNDIKTTQMNSMQRGINVNTNNSVNNLINSPNIQKKNNSNSDSNLGDSTQVNNIGKYNFLFINMNQDQRIVNNNNNNMDNNNRISNSSDLLLNFNQLYGENNMKVNIKKSNQINNNINNTNKVIPILSQKQNIPEGRTNHFIGKNLPQQRFSSYTPNESNALNILKGNYNIGTINALNPSNIKNFSIMKEQNDNQNNKNIIITNKYEQIVNQNINNFFINPESFKNNQISQTAKGNIVKMQNQNDNQNQMMGQNANIHIGQANASVNVNINSSNSIPIGTLNNYRFNSNGIIQNSQKVKIPKNSETQKIPKNNFITGFTNTTNNNYILNNQNPNERKMRVIDYSNTPSNYTNYNPQKRYNNMNQNTNNIHISQNQNKNQFLGYSNSSSSSNAVINYPIGSNKPLNNYNPNLNKKNYLGNYSNMEANINNRGPVKIKGDLSYGKKPSTPDPLSRLKQNTNMNIASKGMFINQTIKGGIKGNKNDPINNRPSTAPQKDKSYENSNNKIIKNINNSYINNYSGPTKRLPSPQIHSNNSLSKTQKINPRYRAPSPVIKSNSNFGIGTLKRSNFENKVY